MERSDVQRCAQCKGELPVGLPSGLCPRCALSDESEGTPFMEWEGVGPFAPRSFHDYEIIEEIARGGMGVVYKARQISLDRIVALKMIRSGQFATKEEVLRFQAEAESAAKLQHPNIVRVHETGEQDGQPFFSMDYVQGGSFAELVRDGPLTARRAATYVRKVALAIHYAHGHGILHRDLKPSNALLDEDDEPRITDFGLAKRAQKGSFLTNSIEVLGSPNFMPPEQAGGKGKAGRYSDVYGLGAILYFLITARAPFQGESITATLHQVINTDPVAPSLLNPSVPLDLETICLKCLEKQPQRRYQTAHEVADELGRFLEDKPIAARPVSRLEKLGRWCHRNPHLSAALATIVLVFIAGFATSVWQWRRAQERADEARLNLYVADMNLAHQALRQRNYAYALEKLRSQIPAHGEPDLRGWEWRFLWQRCQPDEVFSLPGQEPYTTVAFSHDGEFVAAADTAGGIKIWDPIRRRRVTTLSGGRYQPSQRALDFSSDGKLAVLNGGQVMIFRNGTWQPEWGLTSIRPRALFAVMFGPGGTNLWATSDSGLLAWNVAEARETTPPVRFKGACRQIVGSADGKWLAVSSGGSVLAWNVGTQQRVLTNWFGASEQISAMTISSNGLLAVCDRRGWVRVWNLARLQGADAAVPDMEWDTQGGTLFTAAFSPDESVLATAGSDQTIQIWTTATWERLAAFQGHNREVWSLAFSADGAWIVSGGKDGSMKLWEAHRRPAGDILDGTFYPLRFSPDSRTIATLTSDRRLQFWDTTTCKMNRELALKTNLVPHFIEITPDLKRVIMKADNGIHVLDAGSGTSLGILELDPAVLASALPRECSPDSRFVPVSAERASPAGDINFVELFDIATRKRIKSFPDLGYPLCFSSDNRFLAGTTAGGNAAIWDVAKQRRTALFELPRGVSTIAFSGDGKWLAAASGDDVIRLWDTRSLRPGFVLKGHREGVGRIHFSRDSRTLFSTSTDSTVRLWSVGNGQEILALNDYVADPYAVLLSPDDVVLAVSGLRFESPPIKIWRAPSVKAIDAALRASDGGLSR